VTRIIARFQFAGAAAADRQLARTLAQPFAADLEWDGFLLRWCLSDRRKAQIIAWAFPLTALLASVVIGLGGSAIVILWFGYFTGRIYRGSSFGTIFSLVFQCLTIAPCMVLLAAPDSLMIDRPSWLVPSPRSPSAPCGSGLCWPGNGGHLCSSSARLRFVAVAYLVIKKRRERDRSLNSDEIILDDAERHGIARVLLITEY
jgi:hypothetical protein